MSSEIVSLVSAPQALEGWKPVALEGRMTLGSSGRILLEMRRSTFDPSDGLEQLREHASILGKAVSCGISDWEFRGTVTSVESGTLQNTIRLELSDALHTLEAEIRSRVYSETDIGAVFQDAMSAVEHRVDTALAQESVPLAVQYQESSLLFLRRLVNDHGYQIWCDGATVHLGKHLPDPPLELRLGTDIQSYRLFSTAGPERIMCATSCYRDATGAIEELRLPKSQAGEFQNQVAGFRCQTHPGVAFHAVTDESGKESGQAVARRYLHSSVSTRLSLTGAVYRVLKPGSLIAVKSRDGAPELLLVSDVTVRWSSSQHLVSTFVAVSPDSCGITSRTEHGRPWFLTAVVADEPDSLNRVRVSFPWDARQSTTPPLRVISPSWGEDHAALSRVRVGERVLILYGQPDLDPIILGSLPAVYDISDDSASLLLRTPEGQSLAFFPDSVMLRNAGASRTSSIEMTQNKVIISADTVVVKARSLQVE